MKQKNLIILINDIFLTDVLIFGLHSLTTTIASDPLYLLLYSIPGVILRFFSNFVMKPYVNLRLHELDYL